MARTRIIIGHPEKAGSTPFIVYLGSSGSEAQAAIEADTAAHHYEIFEGPGRRKSNARFSGGEMPVDAKANKGKASGKPKEKKSANSEKATAAQNLRSTADSLVAAAEAASNAADAAKGTDQEESLIKTAIEADAAAKAAVLAADEAEAALKP